jgi:hypothetical protein
VLHVEVRDPDGALWRLATQDADWTPSDPAALLNHSVERADLDENNGELRLDLSGGSSLKVMPGVHEAEDDPPNWKLLTPDGLALVFGPGGRWQLNRASEVMREEEAGRLPGEEMLLRLSQRDHIQRLIVLAVGLSIVSIAVAAVALAFALH